MRALILSAFVALAWVPAARAQDFDDKPRKRSASSSSGQERAAPTGFLVAPDDEDVDVSTEQAPDAEPPPSKTTDKKAKRRTGDDADVAAWTDAPKPKGLVVIDENTTPSSVVRMGEDDPDRAGRPLGSASSSKGGLGLVPSRTHPGGSFTFKANAAVNEPDEPDDEVDDPRDRASARHKASQQAPAKGRPAAKPPRAAPVGLIVPTGSDDEEEFTPTASTHHKDDPFGDDSPPTPAPNARAAEPSDDEEEAPSGGGWAGPSVSVGGSGAYKPAVVHEETFISAPPKGVKQPEPERVIAPPPGTAGTSDAFLVAPSSKAAKAVKAAPVKPARRVEPEPVASEPEPPASHRLLSEPSREPERTPVTTPEIPPEAPADPFAKMDAEMRALEGKPPPEVLKAPEIKLPEPPLEDVRPRRVTPRKVDLVPEPDAPVRAVVPDESAGHPDIARSPTLIGFSFLGAAGLALARDPRTSWTPDLALGGSIEWWPSFAPSIFLDASFMHATRSLGTNMVQVDSAWNHAALRLMYLRIVGESAYLGVGGGVLVTQTTAHYSVIDGGTQTADAAVARVGADASFMVGYGLGPLLLRLDARVLLRGGLRLDFLPAIGVGLAL